MYLNKVVCPVIQYNNLIVDFVSLAVREIMGRQVGNLVQMAKIMVYNVELDKMLYAYIYYCS